MTAQQTKTPGITFAVQQVERATKPLPTHKTQEAIKALVGSEIESCCDYTADCIKKADFHPLLAAAHFAFSQHRPLILSPDMIWTTIVQGLAQHVKNHAQKLRHQFVGHKGKLEIRIDRTDMHRGSPENAWADVIHQFSEAIQKHLGPKYDQLIADFSTTGPAERTACEVALLDTFQPYFELLMVCICGIPEITLDGTTDDWQRLRNKVEHLAPYGLDWWLPNVRKICNQFVRASKGDIDLRHWKNIYKQEQAYGWDVVNGWLVELIPYVKNGQTGNFTVRNPLLRNSDEAVSTNVLPSGISQVPFRCRWRGQTEDSAMEFLGGFLGVTQDTATLALRPKLGWAVRQGAELDGLFAKLSKYKPASPLDGPEFDQCIEGFGLMELPGDFLSFYKKCNGVNLAGCRFLPLDRVKQIEGRTGRSAQGMPEEIVILSVGPWVRFCDLPDGSFVAIELHHTYEKGWRVVRATADASLANGPVIAWSFKEFLESALASEGRVHGPTI